MRIEVHDSILDFDAAQWNSLAGDRYPFNRHEFIAAGEETGCVSPDSGWTPKHLGAWDGDTLCGAMLLYEKSHSWGEFVFDWSWAQAYERHGLEYYPKLVSASPFTPAPATRLMARDDDADVKTLLLDHAVSMAKENHYSSLHVLFPEDSELAYLEKAGLKIRKDCQFHWHNHDYQSFDDFLAAFSSAKRKKARRDRRHVEESGIRYRWSDGNTLTRAEWTEVYELISRTFMRRGSMPYYDLDFLTDVSSALPDNILVVFAEQDGEIIATAVFYRGADTLYGRYWGSNKDINALHFETCYYQGIDYCIANGIKHFEPGTQGEHKISRGFTPRAVHSAHWLARPEFFSAIKDYLEEEKQYIENYMDAVDSHSPFRERDESE